MTVSPRLLLVEDSDIQGDFYKDLFSAPQTDWAATAQVPRFQVTWVRTARQAMEELRQAADHFTPFDVMVFDLGLPESDPDSVANFSTGLRVLKEVQQRWNISACAAITILSTEKNAYYIKETYLAGADNYAHKESDKADSIYQIVVTTYEIGRTRLHNKWLQLRQQQEEQWHAVQSCARMADRMTGVVSASVSALMSQLGDLTRFIEDHYQLNVDRDKDEPVCHS